MINALLLFVFSVSSVLALEMEIAKEYSIIEINGKLIGKDNGLKAPTITLDGKLSRVSGTTGVNRYGGGYTIKDGVLTIANPMSSMMAGQDEAMRVESQFMLIISLPMRIEESKSGLVLKNENGNMLLSIR